MLSSETFSRRYNQSQCNGTGVTGSRSGTMWTVCTILQFEDYKAGSLTALLWDFTGGDVNEWWLPGASVTSNFYFNTAHINSSTGKYNQNGSPFKYKI